MYWRRFRGSVPGFLVEVCGNAVQRGGNAGLTERVSVLQVISDYALEKLR